MEWEPRSLEDRLLFAYWRQVGGRIYVEVPIGGPGGPGNWPLGCTIRRIDGVRFPAAGGEPAIMWFSGRAAEFEKELSLSLAEVIEIKASLNRTVIGQAIAGVDMFERQYGRPCQAIILCEAGDSALEWVCNKRSITVAKVVLPPKEEG